MSELSNCIVLIVDDTEANIDVLVEALSGDYEIIVEMDSPSAIETVSNALARGRAPDLILLDIMMPGMDGYQVCEQLKADAGSADIPIVFLTALTEVANKTRGFLAGAVDYVTKPFEILEVKARVETHLRLALAKRALARQNEILEEKVNERTRELAITQDVTIQALASLSETRDNETGGHIQRTKNYVRALAINLKDTFALDDRTIDLLYKSAPLHDIGKVGVPDAILLKPGKLTDEEFEQMKQHPTLGKNALEVAEHGLGDQSSSFLRFAKEIAYGHHERWDGQGYPQQLAGEAIPLSARLMAVADVYDALISHRVYKPPFPHTQAVSMILEGRGTHFDPQIIDAFMELQEEFRQIALTHADYDEEREALAK